MRKALFLLTLTAALSTAASAATIFSRPLPIANLNNAAGASRSNVAWVSGQVFGPDYYIAGDDFSVASATTLQTLTVWTVANNTLATGISAPSQEYSQIRLYGGLASGPLSLLSTNYSATLTSYQDGSIYQGSSGTFYPIYALTFTNLNWALAANTPYGFALDADATNVNYSFTLHSSNAGLSGNVQDGADNNWRYYIQNGAQFDFDSLCDTGNQNTCGGFDKSTDINVLLSDTAIPEPSTILLTGIGALALLGFRRRSA
ncbi:MAG: PEP-CTERM sorting domain-containing protein [Bryobacterales bacterium]|nr:PEP-CTERM sorting domain-containing protein [Bryobacterales bacterium]